MQWFEFASGSFNKQIKELAIEQKQRIATLKVDFQVAIDLFKKIEEKVILDDDSNGSHLPTWINVINAFQKEL